MLFLGLIIYFLYTENKELNSIAIGQDEVIKDLNKAIDLQKQQIYYLNYYYSNLYSAPSLQPDPIH